MVSVQRIEPFSGLILLETRKFTDDRGYFSESYNRRVFAEYGIVHEFIQDNISYNEDANTVRGLHFQSIPKAQTKLVRCVSGAIYDVAVDIRPDSPTFAQYFGVELTGDNNRQLLIPKGFAHGFITLIPGSIVAYKVDEYYSAKHDHSIFWADPELAIAWPGDLGQAILSAKDRDAPSFRRVFNPKAS